MSSLHCLMTFNICTKFCKNILVDFRVNMDKISITTKGLPKLVGIDLIRVLCTFSNDVLHLY